MIAAFISNGFGAGGVDVTEASLDEEYISRHRHVM
jgi:hypothetical protein